MENVISEYQRWKQQGESLRTQAKQAMETRFRDLLLEAVHIAQEYHADFGAALKPPPAVTAFRFKAGAKPKPKAKAKAAAATAAVAAVPPAAAMPDKKVTALQKKLADARKKLEANAAAGKPTKNLEDKIYEIEDEIRLSQSK